MSCSPRSPLRRHRHPTLTAAVAATTTTPRSTPSPASMRSPGSASRRRAAAGVVLHRLLSDLRGGEVDADAERRSLRFIALTFVALALYISVEGVRRLVTGHAPDASPVGIALTGLSIVVMPWLARAKRRTGEAIGSALLVADATETRLCAWLSVSTFAGLVAYARLGWAWLDTVAGLVIAGFALKEGREAWNGELTCDRC